MHHCGGFVSRLTFSYRIHTALKQDKNQWRKMKTISNFVIALCVILVSTNIHAGSATQTDWSGGTWTSLQEWGNEFKCQVGIDVYGTPGQLCLDSLEGYLESYALFTGSNLRWVKLDWSGEMPEGTSVEFQIRFTQNGNYAGDWSDTLTAPVHFDSLIRKGHRFIQYRVILSSTDPDITPVLEEVRVTWQEHIYGVLEGTVTWINPRQLDDSLSLEGAAVVLEEQFQQYGAMTDENGFYSFEAPTGIHTFRAMCVACIPHTIDSVLIQQNDTTLVNFALELQPCTETVIILRSDENPNE